jgi:RNA polymerase sigma-70 factor (ECF subfamily)
MPQCDDDEQAKVVTKLFQAHSEGLESYAFTILRDRDDARDAVQAVFLKTWQQKETVDVQKSPGAYLYTAVYNYCLNIKRHEKVKKEYIAGNDIGMVVETDLLIDKERMRQITDAITSLPPRCRLIFSKSRFEEKKYAEIAAELGLSVKTIEVQMGKALKILRKKILGVTDN